jgi:hypothetical protein
MRKMRALTPGGVATGSTTVVGWEENRENVVRKGLGVIL